MEKALKESTPAHATAADIEALKISILAALYELDHCAPKKTEEKSSLTVGFPKGKQQPSRKIVLEISEFLHTTIKFGCACRRTTMAGEISALLEDRMIR